MTDHYRVIVIGGGVVGCSVLFHLAKFGWTDIALLERKELTAGSTWHAAGGYHAINSDPNVARLQDYTIKLYKEIEQLSGQDVGMHAAGGITIAATEARWEFLCSEHARHKVMGIRSELITPQDVASQCPLVDVRDVKGALYSPDEGHVDPYGVTHAYAGAAKQLGATIKRQTRVIDLTPRTSGGWNVITDQGNYLADHVVNAGGLWAREVSAMVGHYPPLVPMEHHYIISDNLPSLESRDTEIPLVVDLDGEIYMRQEQKGVLLGVYETPAQVWSEDTTPWDYGESELLPDRMDRILPALEHGFRRFPEIAEAGIKRVVNGPFTFTPDGNPLVGPVQDIPNFWLACGVLAGFAQGGGIGLTLAQWMIDGEPDGDVFAMDHARFGDFATKTYTSARACETYERRFRLAYPNEQWPAGRPAKKTPLYDAYKQQDAVFGASYGQEQALYFAATADAKTETPTFRRSNAFDSVAKECDTTRNRAGMIELSAYAKYLVEGPAAGSWLDRIFASKLPKTGKVKLAPMLSHKGRVTGDFTVMCLSETKYLLVASAALQAWHSRWFSENLPSSGVRIENVTDPLQGVSIAGPDANRILAKLLNRSHEEPISKFMSVQEMDVGFAPATVARLSLTGETGYEIYVPSQYAPSLRMALLEAGSAFGLLDIGVYALLSMRLEKGYGIWSREFSPDYTPSMCGLDKFVDYNKRGFIGRDAVLKDRDSPPPHRLTLMRIETDNIDASGYEPILMGNELIGFTTSGGYGHFVEQSLAMGYVREDFINSDAEVVVLGERRNVSFLDSPAYDPMGERMRS
nr:FAD-dependent oxidoreductase [Hyphomonas sp. Mor2]